MFPTEAVPERIGVYKIVRRGASTGSAKVYVGRKEGPMGFSKLYTLKLVPNTAEGDERFVEELTREAAICSTLNHQALQRMIDFFEHDKQLVLVLEHVDGPSLERFVSYLEQNKKPLTDAAKAYIGREVASALVHAHAARDEDGKPMPIVHRGLHPEHVLVGWDGQVRLSGFGMGKILGRSPDTVVAVQKSGLGFKAPEQLRGEAVTPKADVYGLGLFLWTLFTGQKPSDKGIRPARLASVRKDLPVVVTMAIDAALEPALDKRPATCRDIETALGRMHGIDKGRDEICEKVDLLKESAPDSAAKPASASGVRPRVALQSVRPAQAPASSKERLSTIPPAPPTVRASTSPPPLNEDAPPKSVYPLLRALAEKIPKPDAGIPKAPRLPDLDDAPFSTNGVELEADRTKPERPPRSGGAPKLAIATPLELDSKPRAPRTEWMESVPDEDAIDKLFDDAVSRSQAELDKAGIGRGASASAPDGPVTAPLTSRRRMQFADTLPGARVAPTTPEATKAPKAGPTPVVIVSPPLGPPPDPGAKPVRFGPPPVAPAPPKLMRGFARPAVEKAGLKRPSVVLLAVVFGLVAIGAALMVTVFSDKPGAGPAASASALGSAPKAPPPASALRPVASSAPPAASVEPPAAPLPYGQGYITVVYPVDAMVYVSGKKLGQTNTRLQSRCGRFFIRVAKATESRYPEWLSAGESVKIPCQDSVRVEITR